MKPTLLLGLAALLLSAPPLGAGRQDPAAPPQPSPKEQELAALKEKLAGEPAAAEKVQLLLKAGYALQDLERNAEAAECFAEGAELARAQQNDGLLAVHLGNLAYSCFYLGDYTRGLAACNEAIEVAKKLDRKDHLWRLANTAGAVNLRLADFRAAMTAFDLALENVPPDEPGALGALYNNLATAHMYVGELARADELLDLAQPLLAEHGTPLEVSAVYATRADLRVLQGNEAGALAQQEEALRLRREVGAEAEMAQSLVGLGRIHFGLGDAKQSAEVLEEALAIQERLGLQGDRVATLGCLAEAYSQLGRPDEAEEAAQASLALADQVQALGVRVEALHSLAKVREAEGDLAGALAAVREAIQLERRQNTLDVRARTAALQESIEVAKTKSDLEAERQARHAAELEKELALEAQRTGELKQSLALAAEGERRRAQVAWVASICAVLLFGTALLGWGLFLSKRKTLRELRRAESELRAADAAARERTRELESARGEIRELEEDRIRSSHLETLGRMARGVAHDFNNSLQAVVANVSFARSAAGRPDLESELESCVAAIEQATQLSRQLLNFAQGADPEPELCDLGELLREGAALGTTGSRAQLSFDLSPDLWRAEVNRGQFLQIVINLVQNAVQAMPPGGTVTLSARNLSPMEGGDGGEPAVEIQVEDTGPGIPEELSHKVFESSFSTKPGGNGLGLATVQDIVRRHGGSVRLVRGRQRGACFAVVLPAAPDSPLPAHDGHDGHAQQDRRAAPSAPEPSPALVRVRVLALDDEAPVRAVYQRMLALLGLEAVVASDGAEALAAFDRARDEGRPFDLLILDLTLPGGMDGAAVFEAVRRRDPAALAIVSSGYYDSEVFNDPGLGGFAGKIEKPFTLEMLGGAIRAALAQRAGR